ncbi:hypothetical protein C7271_04735 [filamentous cyanobacterium CCP5]|nr:hypothetical protein C7271_04735 [filamentous cyanobacterium CCP5]
MQNAAYIVNRNLQGIKLNQVLDIRKDLKDFQISRGSSQTGQARPLVEGDQELKPNQLYKSTTATDLYFYLPQYRISTSSEGHPAVELRYGEKESGEKGRLTITAGWTPPSAPTRAHLKVMEHTAELALRYKISVEHEVPNQRGGSEQVMALNPLERFEDGVAQSTTIFYDKHQFDAVYQAMKQSEYDTELEINIQAPVGLRTWRQVFVGQVTEQDQARVLKDKQALVTKVVDTQEQTQKLQQLIKHQAMVKMHVASPSAEEKARVQISREMVSQLATFQSQNPSASVSRQSLPLRQPLNLSAVQNLRAMPVMAASQSIPTANSPLKATPRITMSPAVMRAIATSPQINKSTSRVSQAPSVARANTSGRVTATPVARRVNHSIAEVTPQITAKTIARVNAPQLTQAIRATDLRINNRAMVPAVIPLDRERRPAIVDAELDNQQVLPFGLDPAKHPQVYVTEGFVSSGPHLLLPRILPGTNQRVFQDNLMPDVVYIAPTAFRLERIDAPPYGPDIKFVPSEFGTAENDDEVEVLFRVAVVFRLEPWIDPEVIKQAQVTIPGARLSPIVPRDTQLFLRFNDEPEIQPEAEINPNVGITHHFELDHNAFNALWQTQLSQGTGLSGKVTYTLFDGSTEESDVQISFYAESPEPFDISFEGPVDGQPGRFRYCVRNRIESPVKITNLLREPLDQNIYAHAVNAGELINRILRPQEMITVDYQLSPADADIVPEARSLTILGEIQPDFNALLRLLMVKQGYESLGFSLQVEAVAGTFESGKTANGETLSGLLVEFDDGTQVILTPEEEVVEVNLIGRLIDQILGTADDEHRYFYRVTNLTSDNLEGARTHWREEQGTSGPLKVTPAVVQLDF